MSELRRLFENSIEDNNEITLVDIIDPETGEIKTVEIDTLPAKRRMVAYADKIHQIARHMNQVKETAGDMIGEIKYATDALLRRAEEQLERLHELAGNDMADLAQAGECAVDKQHRPIYEVPGKGKFSYRKMPDRVDTSGYDELEEDQKVLVATSKEFKPYFRVKYSPDLTALKKEIKTSADEGRAMVGGKHMTLFRLEEGSDKLCFKEV